MFAYVLNRVIIIIKRQIDSRRRNMAQPEEMYRCQTVNCGCLYDPDRPHRKQKELKGVRFVELPEDWCCPNCGAGKHMFKPMAGSD
jgi:rubredoxin